MSQVGFRELFAEPELSKPQVAAEARQQVAGALARALGEHLENPELQRKLLAVVAEPAAADDEARSFTPYDGSGRRAVARCSGSPLQRFVPSQRFAASPIRVACYSWQRMPSRT